MKTKVKLTFKKNTPSAQRQTVRTLANQLAQQQDEPKPKRVYVRDDLGHRWYFTGERIKCVGDRTPDGGYYCDSLEDGVKLLNEYGYITTEGNTK